MTEETNRRPAVLLVAPRRPGDGHGGAERHLCDLARVFEKIGACVSAISVADGPKPGAVERWAQSVSPLLASPLAARRLQRAGLIHADLVLSTELMGIGLSAKRHLHLFFGSYSGFRATALRPKRLTARPVEAVVAAGTRWLENMTQGSDGAVSNSIGLREALRRSGVRARDEVIVPPIDTSHFRPTERRHARIRLGLPLDEKIVLYAGRLEYAKGTDRLANIVAKLGPGWRLVCACPNPVGDAGIPRTATMLRDVTYAEMPTVYSAADVVIQPSRFEGYSLVVAEALCCGTPVVTSLVGHAVHLLDGPPLVRMGVIGNADDCGQWAEAIDGVTRECEAQRGARYGLHKFAEALHSHANVARQWYALLSVLYPELAWHAPRP